jgi:excisionase family DNA binding protein
MLDSTTDSTKEGRPHLLTTAEVGSALGMGTQRVYQLIWSGSLPHTKVNGRYVIPRQAFDQWLAERNAEALASVRPREVALVK